MWLEGKRVLITGGSRGLGRSLCVVFAREGASVAFTYSTDQEGAGETVNQVSVHGRPVVSARASVLDRESMGQLVARCEAEWGGIDILVNNAGVSRVLPIALLEEEDWDELVDINLKGTYLTTRLVLRGMFRRRSGRILNIGSVAGIRPLEAPVHYAASKAGVKGFTEALAKEVGRYGITVNCLAPGILEGGVGLSLPQYRLDEYLKHCALGRVGTFEEVSEAAAFLVSDLNSYMNGGTLTMDGGL
ncbi:MAG: 3-oxoacyl-ACP reductase FabG [Actinomycetota bacterium]|nr:3-oxoacyl-ACP reductase FabG [Actinomycetota bacterium]